MITVRVMPTLSTPMSVDDFGADVERSIEGGIHFRPSSTKQLTMGELEHILQHHKSLAVHLDVVIGGTPSTAPVKSSVTKTAEAKPDVSKDLEPEPEPEPAIEPVPEPSETHKNAKKGTGGVKKRKVRSYK